MVDVLGVYTLAVKYKKTAISHESIMNFKQLVFLRTLNTNIDQWPISYDYVPHFKEIFIDSDWLQNYVHLDAAVLIDDFNTLKSKLSPLSFERNLVDGFIDFLNKLS